MDTKLIARVISPTRLLWIALGLLLALPSVRAAQPNGHTLGGLEQFPIIGGTSGYSYATAQDISNFVGSTPPVIGPTTNLSPGLVTDANSAATQNTATWMSYLTGTSNPNPVVFGGATSLNAGGVLSGTFTGSPTLSGSVSLTGGGNLSGTFLGSPTFNGSPVFNGITGNGSALNVTATGGTTATGLQTRFAQVYDLKADFGATGDGTTDDTTAVQAFFTKLGQGYAGTCSPGTYRITAQISAFPTSTYRLNGTGQGVCIFYIDFNDWTAAGIDLSNPNSPTTSNRGKPSFWSNIQFKYNPALTAPPIALRDRYATDLHVNDVYVSQYTVNRGTAVALSAVFNSRVNGLQVWGAGGYYSSHLISAGTSFSITAGSTTLTASANTFVAADATSGLSIILFGITAGSGDYSEVFTVTGYTDATHVTVSRAAYKTHTSVPAAFSSITGSMSATSNTLTINNATAMSSADVGRVVYIPQAGTAAGSGLNALRTTITAVSGATITVADNSVGAVTNQPVIISPAMAVYPESDASTNDLNFEDFHAEQDSGTSIVVQNALYFTMHRAKIEGLNSSTNFGQTNIQSQFLAAFFGTDVKFDGVIDGRTPQSQGYILDEGNVMENSFGPMGGSYVTGNPAIGAYANNAKSTFYLTDLVSNGALDPAWLPSLAYSDGSSTYGFSATGPIGGYTTGPTLPAGYFAGIHSANPIGNVGATGQYVLLGTWSASQGQALHLTVLGESGFSPGAQSTAHTEIDFTVLSDGTLAGNYVGIAGSSTNQTPVDLAWKNNSGIFSIWVRLVSFAPYSTMASGDGAWVPLGSLTGSTTLPSGATSVTPDIRFRLGGNSGSTYLPFEITTTGIKAGLSITNAGITADTAHTDSTVCQDTTTHQFYSGTGTLGVCLGTSSLRYKRNWEPLVSDPSAILDLKPGTYWYKPGYGDDGARQQVGFLAEDVVNELPNLVGLDAEGKPNSVDMLGVVPYVVQEEQRQRHEIVVLELICGILGLWCAALTFGLWKIRFRK